MAFYDQLGSFFVGETEEERRRREEEERLKSLSEAEPTPFKQTIVTDPVTGKQTMKMEGDVRDFTAANPMTPTVSGPVSPDVMPKREMMPPEQYVGTPGFNPAAAPVTFSDIRGQEVEMRPEVQGQPTTPAVAPTAPIAPETIAPTPEGIEAGPPASAMMPTPAVPGAATTQPQKSQAQLELERRQAQQPTTAPTAEGLAMGPSMVDAQPEAFMSKIEAAKNNPQALAAINADTQAPSWVRSLAAEELGNTILRQRQEQQAGKKFNDIVQNQGRGFERAMKDPSEEGSVFRAYLYQRFGLNDLAKAEQEKLGANDIYQTADLPGGPAVIRFGANGRAKSGVFASGEFAGQQLSADELAQATGSRALGKGASLSSEVYVDKTTGQRYRSGFDSSGKAALVNVQGGAAYKGDPRNLEVQSIGTAIAKAEGAKAVDLRYAGPIAYTKAGAEYIGKFNAENGTNLGYASQTPGAPLIDRNTGQTVTPGAGGTIRATTTVPAAAPVTTTTTPAAAPTAPTKIMEAPRFRSPGFENESPAAFEARQKNWSEANKPLAKKEQNNQYFANETYSLIKPIAEQIKQSTGSGIGAGVDKLAGVIGASPRGAEAIAQLDVLSYSLLSNVPRFEGPQSDRDVAAYNRAAGDLNNPEKPIKQRLAALNAIVTLLKKYDKDKTNDWTFGEGGEVDTSNPLLQKKQK